MGLVSLRRWFGGGCSGVVSCLFSAVLFCGVCVCVLVVWFVVLVLVVMLWFCFVVTLCLFGWLMVKLVS